MIIAEIGNSRAFRQALREWLPDALADDPGKKDGPTDEVARQKWWMAQLSKEGLGTPHWPREFGGVDMSLFQRAILSEELARANSPLQDLFMISMNHVPATLLAWGTEQQKKRYLPAVAQGTVWCQGFSEPGAGSDLASLRTRAEQHGDEYVINGQKIWSSVSMYAQHCILLTRTDPDVRKHAGITFFLLDMKAPGVEVRPIRQFNGEAEFGEIFLTDVRIPVEDRVGEENQGWTIAQTTLSAERGIFALEQSERLRFTMEQFHCDSLERGARWLGDSRQRQAFVQLFARMQGLRAMIRKLLFAELGSENAIQLPVHIKVLAALLRKDFGAFLVESMGLEAQFTDYSFAEREAMPEFMYLNSFSGMLGGGTNEIMRNIIAERHLEMPRN